MDRGDPMALLRIPPFRPESNPPDCRTARCANRERVDPYGRDDTVTVLIVADDGICWARRACWAPPPITAAN